MMTHLPFSAHGLFFLSGAWISGSFFSFSSTYSRIAAMLFDNGHRSIEAWYFMFSICFFSASRSMVARILGSIAPLQNRYLYLLQKIHVGNNSLSIAGAAPQPVRVFVFGPGKISFVVSTCVWVCVCVTTASHNSIRLTSRSHSYAISSRVAQ